LIRRTGEGQTAIVSRIQEGGVQGVEVQDERRGTIMTVMNGGEEARNETRRNIMTGTAMAEGIGIEIDIATTTEAIMMRMVTTSGAGEARYRNGQAKMEIQIWDPGKQRGGKGGLTMTWLCLHIAIEHS
jgi:hypothetical protein